MKTLLIKISGELFSYQRDEKRGKAPHADAIKNVVQQIKKLTVQHRVGIVVGGGNFFRGANDTTSLEIHKSAAHNIGMLSTIVNGILLRDLLKKENVSCELLSAFSCPDVTRPLNQTSIDDAFAQQKCVIFVGGTGNPFFTTDTNAVLRALQIGAEEVWKATKVDGVYDADPMTHKDATFYNVLGYQEVLDKKLAFMDRTAITLAQEHNLPIRVFNLFTPDSFHKALENPGFGSTIQEM